MREEDQWQLLVAGEDLRHHCVVTRRLLEPLLDFGLHCASLFDYLIWSRVLVRWYERHLTHRG